MIAEIEWFWSLRPISFLYTQREIPGIPQRSTLWLTEAATTSHRSCSPVCILYVGDVTKLTWCETLIKTKRRFHVYSRHSRTNIRGWKRGRLALTEGGGLPDSQTELSSEDSFLGACDGIKAPIAYRQRIVGREIYISSRNYIIFIHHEWYKKARINRTV